MSVQHAFARFSQEACRQKDAEYIYSNLIFCYMFLEKKTISKTRVKWIRKIDFTAHLDY